MAKIFLRTGVIHHADDHGWGDVIGEIKYFDISSMDIDITGAMLTVDIFTKFAGRGDDRLFSSYTFNGRGIGYGDLFLSSKWTPHVDLSDTIGLPYRKDDHRNGTIWTYGFALDNRYASGGGVGTLYQLNSGNNDADALLTGDFMSGAIFRNGQEVAVDSVNGDVSPVRNGVWTVYPDHLNFSIDISGASLLNGPEIGAHWAMTCGNDTIEGSTPIPEPATIFLFGAGLLGLATARRKKSQRML